MNKLEDIKKGTVVPITVNFTTNAVPIDISGYTVWIMLKSDPSLLDVDAELNVINIPGGHSNPSAGQTILSLTSLDTSIEAGKYYYEIWVKDATNKDYCMKFDTDTIKVTE